LIKILNSVHIFYVSTISERLHLSSDSGQKVVVQIQREIHTETTIQIFAGRYYYQYLVPKLEDAGYIIELPLIRVARGKQVN